MAAIVSLCSGCPTERAEPAPATRQAEARPTEQAAPAKNPQTAPAAAEGTQAEGKWLESAKVSPQLILGKTPAEAQQHLGSPRSKGMRRKHCVRFTPQRTWFSCAYTWQSYDDPTGTFRAIQVAYEDGKASAVTYDRIPGEGPFDPVAALATVGVALPGQPQLEQPAPDVRLWSWFNDAAKLTLGGEQYRVTVSTERDDWEHSKVDIIANSPLTPEQRARVVQTKKKEPPAK